MNNSNDRLRKVWNGMKYRCYSPHSDSYKNYGGRGITVCDEWLGENGFEHFHAWAMTNGYDENAPKGECTIDRIDNNKGYSPNNCRFVNIKAQANNKRNNHLVDLGGNKVTVAEATDMTGLNYNTMLGRIKRGWGCDTAVDTPLNEKKSTAHNNKTYEYNGEHYTIGEISKKFGIDKRTFRTRLEKGMTVAQAIESPVKSRKEEATIEYQGKKYTIRQLRKEFDCVVSCSTLEGRLKWGWDVENALYTPTQKGNWKRYKCPETKIEKQMESTE